MRNQPKTRLADELRRAIEAEIVSGQLAPSSRLEEATLAQRFKVSRTPVREALMQLASIGLVEIRPHQGAVVAAMTIQRMMEMFEVMAHLEALCAKLAARRATRPERERLRHVHALCKQLVEAGDPDRYYDQNKLLHELIYAGSHNRFLEENTRAIRNRVSPYRRMTLRQPGRLATSWKEHDAVVAAIMDGDGERAAAAMEAHVAVQSDVFTDLISSLPPAYVQLQTG
jgi:DNA-binding GntR family transcriptional regulator